MMNGKKDFLFKNASEEDLIRIQKNVVRDRQKQKDAQNWDNYIRSNTDYKTKSIQSCTKFEHEPLRSEVPPINQLTYDAGGIYPLHDPHDLNHLHGLRNRLFNTFNEFSKILNNALDPPVMKITKKVLFKIKEPDQKTYKNDIFDLNLLLTEIKKESKNENLYTKKNITNIMLKKGFQMKLIQCHKLLIDTVQLCSKTLEADIYYPIQSKMKYLIQIISTLSLITRKYLFGELFKKKKQESFDLVEKCKVLEKMLDEYGYKDTDNENDHYTQQSNILNKLSKKASIKNKIQSFSTKTKHSDVYTPIKLKIGSNYANKWSKNSLKLVKNKKMVDGHSPLNKKTINEQPLSLKNDHILHSYDKRINSDEIKTKIEDFHCGEEMDDNDIETKNSRLVYNHEVINLPKNKIQSFSTKTEHSDVYTPIKLKKGPDYANKWSTNSLKLVKNKKMVDEHSPLNKKTINEQSISLKNDHIFNDKRINSDEIKTKIEDFHCEEEIDDNNIETKNSRLVYNHEVINSPTSTIILKSNNNVGLFFLKENIWRNFPLKNSNFSQNGCLRLYVSPENMKDIFSYKQQFNQISKQRLQFMKIVFNVAESIMDDLIKKVLLKFENKIIYELMRMELFE